MSPSPSFISRTWILVPLVALGLLIALYAGRIQRVQYVTGIAQEESAVVAASPTGYAGETRELIVPEHVADSYGWIAQTQEMLAQGNARIRRIDYENAPFGREVHASSPYRWWLGLTAWLDHLLTRRPLGFSVEHAALWADPLLHLLFLGCTTVWVARRFGAFAAALYSVSGAVLYPFAAGFLPGAPDDFALALVLSVSSLLPLLAGIIRLRATTKKPTVTGAVAFDPQDQRSTRNYFFAAGVIGGVGVWVHVASQVSILVGIGLSAVLAAVLARRAAKKDPAGEPVVLPWRAWSLGGAVTVLLAYLVEYFPSDMGAMELRVVHPLYGLAWLGGGELLARLAAWIQGVKSNESRVRAVSIGLLALVAVAGLPVAMWKSENLGIFAVDLLSFRLTKQVDGVMAPNMAVWFSRGGLTPIVWATLLPLLWVVLSAWLMFRRSTSAASRIALTITLGPLMIAAILAYLHLRDWQMVDGTLLVLQIVVTLTICEMTPSISRRAVWAAVALLILIPGFIQLLPRKESEGGNVLTLPEVEGLVERDLAHWLARHIGPGNPAVMLAPPGVSNTLYYYGGLRGLASLNWENKDGLSVALRLMISTSPEEAHALVRRRGVTHIVVPSWDPFFEEYTRSALIQNGQLFITGLHRWGQPSWLRPIPYQLPTIAGFDQQSVLIFEVVDDQDDAAALSRLTEYFIEMGQLQSAIGAGQALKRFPADFGALIARAQLDVARGDAEGFAISLDATLKRLSAGADRTLPWDRRVSLAAVLARGKQMDKAKVQTQHALAEVDEPRLRSLTTYSLFHLLGLGKGFGLQISDPHLRDLALELLPTDLRNQIQR